MFSSVLVWSFLAGVLVALFFVVGVLLLNLGLAKCTMKTKTDWFDEGGRLPAAIAQAARNAGERRV